LKNILLVNPWVCDFALYDLWIKPVGLLRLSSLLKGCGYKISYLDFLDRHHPKIKRLVKDDAFGCGKFYKKEIEKPEAVKHIQRPYFVYGLPKEIVEEELARLPRPDFILMTSGMTYWYPGLQRSVGLLKERFPQVPIILGGIYATFLPEHAQRIAGIAQVVPGANLLQIGEKLGKIMESKIEIKDALPYPDYRLLRDTSSLAIETSRGCPFNCTYCGSKLLYPEFLQRKPQEVVQEIKFYFENWPVKNIAFYDDALLVNSEEHLLPILEEIIDLALPINFHTPNGLHARFVTKKVAQHLRKANFKTIRLSLETPDPRRQKATGGKISSGELERAVENLQNAGYNGKDIEVYLMLGMPEQKEEEVREGIDFVHKLGVKVILASYSLVPGTGDYQKLIEQKVIKQSLDPLWHNNTIFPLVQGNFTLDSIKELRVWAAQLNKSL